MFYARLTELRKKAGLSQEELGKKVDVTRQAVSRWEQGLSTPDMDKLIALADLFDCSIDYLVDREDTEKEKSNEEERTVTEETQSTPSMPERTRQLTYEYKSKTTIRGLPLVHIHLGWGVCRAKGVIAIGNIATGVVAVGGVAAGGITLGGLSLGVIGFGGLTCALFFGLGALCAAILLAVGGVAAGIFAVGGVSFGMYAIGGVAFASKIALGGYACGKVAMGVFANGDFVFLTGETYTAEQIKEAIFSAFPHISKFIADLFANLFMCSRIG